MVGHIFTIFEGFGVKMKPIVFIIVILLIVFNVSATSNNEFEELFEKWSPQCRDQHVAQHNNGSDYLTSKIPWSLNTSTIHDFVRGNGAPYCKNIDQLLENVKLPIANYTCRVPWLTMDEICETIQAHSFFVWNGDSLMRHMIQALIVILTKDYQFGGFPPRPNGTDIPYKYCECDGQFSESLICRDYAKQDYNSFFSFTDIKKHNNACQAYLEKNSIVNQAEFISETMNTRYRRTFEKDRDFFNRIIGNNKKAQCVNYTKPIFFHLQGGHHYQVQPIKFLKEYLTPYLHNLNTTSKKCMSSHNYTYNINILVSGVVTSAQYVVQKYAHQSEDLTIAFYAEVNKYLKEFHPDIKLLNFLALTAEGINRSDGFHSFTDINFIKVMITLNAMRMMLK